MIQKARIRQRTPIQRTLIKHLCHLVSSQFGQSSKSELKLQRLDLAMVVVAIRLSLRVHQVPLALGQTHRLPTLPHRPMATHRLEPLVSRRILKYN